MRVCILGGGLTSLTLAQALVNQKIHVDIIDSKKPIIQSKFRTIGISKTNVEFFNKYIVNVDNIIWNINKIEIFSENLKNEKLINFQKKNDYLFSILKNHNLLEILKKKLIKNKYFSKLNAKVKKNFFKDYNLVINTDPHHNISKKYFNRKIEKKYNSCAYITIIEHEKNPNRTAFQIFTKRGPLAFLPLSNFETSIVYSMKNQTNKFNENLGELIKKYGFKFKIKKIHKIQNFELNAVNLRNYHFMNILAFGDLLHKIHPLAGQGFNMTIRDMTNLIKIINNKISIGLPLDSSICREFEKTLRHKNFIFSNGIDLIYELFNFENKINNSFLAKTIQSIGKNSYLNKTLINAADKGLII